MERDPLQRGRGAYPLLRDIDSIIIQHRERRIKEEIVQMPQETLIEEFAGCTGQPMSNEAAQRQIEDLAEALSAAFVCIGDMNRVLDGIVDTITAFRNRL